MSKYAKKTEAAFVMTITPQEAEEMLATSPGNRRTREWHVALLAGAMERGEWRVTSQGIGFNKDGQLRDAHHRLMACVKSGCSFRSVVVLGLEHDAYEVTDTGIKRAYSDLLNEDERVATVLRFACVIAVGSTRPTVAQMRPFIDAGLGAAAHILIEHCGTSRRFFSSAPMRLAACITIMNGGDAKFVLDQYKALCNLDFDAMSSAAKALVKQVDGNKVAAINQREVLARGLRVFNVFKKDVTKIQVSSNDIEEAVALVRHTLRKSIKQGDSL